MLPQMNVSASMACTHDHAPAGKRTSAAVPSAAHNSTLTLQHVDPEREPSPLYHPRMRRTPAWARWALCALALALAMGLAALSGAAQSTILINGRNLQTPINHGLPDKLLGFTYCRLRYQNIRQ
jgi:hypothetical protein